MRIRFIESIVGAVVIAMAILPMTVQAASPVGASTPEGQLVATIPMVVDCSNLPTGKRAEALLRKNHLCGFGPTDGITPENSVAGPCGTLSLYVYNAGDGNLQWKAEITSSLGPFTTAAYSGTWANTTLIQSGLVNRSFSGLTTDWLDIFPILTGYGNVIGRINVAVDRTFWGLICYNVAPVDSTTYVTPY